MNLATLRDRFARARAAFRERLAVKRRNRVPIPRRTSDRIRWVLAWLCEFPYAIPAGLFAILFLFGFARFLYRSDYFVARQTTVEGTERLSAERVRATIAARYPEGVPLLKLDAESLRKELEAHPEVQHASIRRSFPDELRVSIRERAPEILLLAPAGMFLVAGDGVVSGPATIDDFRRAEGPVLTGFPTIAVAPGTRLPREAWRAIWTARETLAVAHSELAPRVSEIHWEEAEGLSLIFDSGLRAVFGRRSLAETGAVLEAFLTEDRSRWHAIESIDLRTPQHFTWMPRAKPVTQTAGKKR